MIELYALLCTIAKYPILIQGEKHMKKLLLGASIIALTVVTSMTFADDQTNNQIQTQPAATATPDTQPATPTTSTINSATAITTTPDADQAAADKKKQEMMDQTQQPANTTPTTQPAAPSQSDKSSY